MPNFEDLHYVFLTEKVQMSTYMYDFLNLFAYVGVMLLTVVYNRYLSKMEVKTLIQWQLYIMLGVNCLQMANSLRWNAVYFKDATILENNASDVLINSICFLFGGQAVASLAVLPMQVVLTRLVPENVEAAMMSLLGGVFIF